MVGTSRTNIFRWRDQRNRTSKILWRCQAYGVKQALSKIEQENEAMS